MTAVRSVKHRLLQLEILGRLALARFLIKYVRFDLWKGWVGQIDRGPKGNGWPGLTEERLKQARDVGRIVDRVADRVRLFDAVCLPRAIAARGVLARHDIPSRVVIGSRRDGEAGSLSLHAWLMVGPEVIIGERERERYVAFGRCRADAAANGCDAPR